jgi:predicted chitinase
MPMSEEGELLTTTRLKAICPRIDPAILEAILTEAPTSLRAAGLNDPVRLAHFIAQIATETGGLTRLDENLNYTTEKRLMTVFPSKFKSAAAARPFLRNSEKLANHVYAKKNGNKNPGDGWLYRGSGLIQITGRENFAKVGELIGISLERDPELARSPDSALAIAIGYWRKNKINEVAGDSTDAAVKAVTRRINPALVGLSERKAFFKKALKVLTPPKSIIATGAKSTKRPIGFAPDASGSELSGPNWVLRFPTSRSISDLDPPFARAVRNFVDAVESAGAKVRISATTRPKERAYLMHWAWMIAKGGVDPASIPPMAGVPVIWKHTTLTKSRAAARQMVAAYGMVHVAALNSRHTERRAIDMTISWKGTLRITRRDGSTEVIATQPRNGSNPRLVAVGAGYSVIKLVTDPPHWSDDGR